MTHDGLGKYLKQKITKAPGETADIVGILKETKADVLVCYLPGRLRGGDQVVRRAGARRPASASSTACPSSSPARTTGTSASQEAGLPIIGDDIKSQVGATIVHRQLARLFHERGVQHGAHLAAQRRRQHGLLQHARARAARLEEDLEDQRRHLDHGPRAARATTSTSAPPTTSPWLTDRKWAHIRLEGRSFGDVPLNRRAEARGLGLAELGRRRHRRGAAIKLALNNGIAGQLDGPSSYLMKSPHTPAPRRRGPRADRGVHRRRTHRKSARSAAPKPARSEAAPADERSEARPGRPSAAR